VDFGRGALKAFAPKTKTTCTVPMLPIIRDELSATYEAAPEGSEFVLTQRSPLPVIRRHVEAAITRAEVPVWPKLLQQLRASFATDAVRTLPANAAAAILGSAKVAAEPYWMTDDTDLQGAAQALQSALEPREIEGSDDSPIHAQSVNGAELFGTAANSPMGAGGFEPP
jgi:hypothetical protein